MKKSRFYTLLALSGILTLGTASAASSIQETIINEKNIIASETKTDPSSLIGEAKEFEGEGMAYPAYSYTDSPINEPKYKNTTTFSGVGSFSQKTSTYDRINVEKVWSSYRGEKVKVALIDTGCRTNHEEFSKTNISSLSYDIGESTSTMTDTSGHGTDTAACVAASINGVGGTGIAPNVELYIIRAVNSSNGFPTANLKSALNYCLEQKVDIINMSIQGYPSTFEYSYVEDMDGKTYKGTISSSMYKTTLQEEINACYEQGITIVGAAGNYNTSTSTYPAANDHVIAVASTGLNSDTDKAGFSNYGDWVDVCAPGYVIVPSSTGTSGYCLNLGTSFSAPIVTGAIALYKSKYPSAKPDQIETALKASCKKLNWSGSGAGQIDVEAFLAIAPKIDVESVTLSEKTKTLTVGETYQLSTTVLPVDADQGLTFESLDTSVCTVSNNGLVTAVGEGSTTVKAISAENSNIYDEIQMTIVPKSGGENEDADDEIKTYNYTSPSGTFDDWSYTTSKGVGSTLPNGQKLYSGNTITLKSQNKNFKKVVLTGKITASGSGKHPSSATTTAGDISYSLDAGTNRTITVTNFGSSIKEFTIALNNADGGNFEVSTIDIIFDSGTTPSVKTLKEISVSNAKTTFTVGDTWTFGGIVTATYSDNSTADVTSDVTFSGNTTSSAGQKTVTVSYKEGSVEKTTTYSITVSAPVVTNYTVTFNSNGGSGTMTSKTTTGSTYVVPECNFTKEGYTFDKWALNSATGNKYTVGTTINNISSNITLYATWTQNSSSTDDFDGYYDSILDSYTDETLKTKLHDLNTSKRKTTIGYDGLRTKFAVTDLDPNGSGKILGFYDNSLVGPSWDQGKTWNREHVWPDSLGGNKVEGDIHMVRPAKVSSNGDRGNLYYGKNIYDPGSLGYENYRGIAARIIFYSAIADTSLNIIDAKSGGSNQMGKLSDLLEWNLTYLPSTSQDASVELKSEQYRNNAIASTSVQGNRNPFIDHPEYACKIWGNTNVTTQKICSSQPVTTKKVTSLSVTGTPTKTSYHHGDSFSPEGLTITATYDDETTANVTSSVTWSPSPLTKGTISVTGTYSCGGVEKSVVINGLTVLESPTGNITMVQSMSSLEDGDLVYLATGLTDSDVGVTGWNNNKDASVSSSVSSWKQYKVVKNGTTYKLMDGTQYITSVSENAFKYGSDGASITLDSSYNMKVGNRWFVINGTNYRCYTSLNSYVPFHIYKVPGGGLKVTSVSLNPKTLSFDLYQSTATKTITATVSGDSGVDTSVVWTSSKESVATVVNGVVTPLGVGQTTITATSTVDSSKSDTCVVTVDDSRPIAVTGVSLDKINASVSLGSTLTLTATVEPSNATNKNVTWSSSDESVATVSDGVLTSKAIGTATITVMTVDGGFTANCSITVTAAPVITYQLEADQETVPYMSGTNHQVSVGVKLYQYSNGVKGSQVASSTGSVDTSVLGPAKISYTYQSVTYETSVKVTNNGASTYVGTSIQGSEKTETLTSALFAATTTSYVDFTNISVQNGTGAIYAGNSAKDASKNIQLRSSNSNSGIVQTKSGGKVTKIKINVGTVKGKINVYGKNTAYSSAADLYGDKQGTLIGSLSATGTITFNTNNQFDYIGLRSNSGAIYISSIEITCGSAGVSYPASPKDQAIAWADYFIKLTGGGEFDGPCKRPLEVRKSLLQEIWGEVSAEYGYMVSGSKDTFCASDATGSIAEAMQHYRYIVDTYGLDDFVKDGSGNAPARLSNKNFLITNVNSVTVFAAIIVMVGAMSVGAYFFYKKRKSDVE